MRKLGNISWLKGLSIVVLLTIHSSLFTQCAPDNNAPQFTDCIVLATVFPDASCQYILADYRDSITVIDSCVASGAITLTQVPAPGTILSNVYDSVFNIKIYADDGNGNIDSCEFSAIIYDTTRPTIISCPNDTSIYTNLGCFVLTPDFTGNISAIDNCSPNDSIIYLQFPSIGDSIKGATSILIITGAIDLNSNTSYCSTYLHLIDTIPPTIVGCVNDTILFVENTCVFIMPDFSSVLQLDDNCGALSPDSVFQSVVDGDTIWSSDTTFSVSIIVSDLSGNRDTCYFNLTIKDSISPTFNNCPSDTIVFVDNDCEFKIPNFILTTNYDDNCTETNQINFQQFPTGGTIISGHNTVQLVTITLTDEYGNASTCNFNLILKDTINPIITQCQNDTIGYISNCSYIIPDYRGNIIVEDNCNSDASTMIINQTPSSGTFVYGADEVYEIQIYVSDTNGNSRTCQFNLVLLDTIKPTALCNDATVYLNSQGSASLDSSLINNGSYDNCGFPSHYSFSQTSFSCFDIGNVDITMEARDSSGNTGICISTITVIDTVERKLICPQNASVMLYDTCIYKLPNFTGGISFIDNCESSNIASIKQYPPAGTIVDMRVFEQSLPLKITAIETTGDSVTCVLNVDLNCKVNIQAPEFISPNGDGKNDRWIVYNLEMYPDNHVRIFNRFGDLVYDKRTYNNSFDGRPYIDGSVFMETEQEYLPDGTYFYLIDLGENFIEPLKGFIQIAR